MFDSKIHGFLYIVPIHNPMILATKLLTRLLLIEVSSVPGAVELLLCGNPHRGNRQFPQREFLGLGDQRSEASGNSRYHFC